MVESLQLSRSSYNSNLNSNSNSNFYSQRLCDCIRGGTFIKQAQRLGNPFGTSLAAVAKRNLGFERYKLYTCSNQEACCCETVSKTSLSLIYLLALLETTLPSFVRPLTKQLTRFFSPETRRLVLAEAARFRRCAGPN